jgi:hypothetical protein
LHLAVTSTGGDRYEPDRSKYRKEGYVGGKKSDLLNIFDSLRFFFI